MQDVNATDQSVTIDIPIESAVPATSEVIPNESTETPQPQVEVKKEELSTNEVPTETPIENLGNVDEVVLSTNSQASIQTIGADTCPTDICEHFPEGKTIKVKPKHAGGRPCEYCKDKDLIQSETDKYYKRHADSLKSGKPMIPYYQELAIELGVDRDVINDWSEKRTEEKELEHPEFNRTIKRIKTLQEVLLLKRTLGRFNPTGAIFQLNTNHKYMPAEKQVLAGDSNQPLEIIITEVENQNAEEN